MLHALSRETKPFTQHDSVARRSLGEGGTDHRSRFTILFPTSSPRLTSAHAEKTPQTSRCSRGRWPWLCCQAITNPTHPHQKNQTLRLDPRHPGPTRLSLRRPARFPARLTAQGRSAPAMPARLRSGPVGKLHQQRHRRRDRVRQMKEKLPQIFVPSRLFIYYNERVIEGTVNTDAGA